MNVFLDTNILLDVILKREPHALASAELWSMCESGQLRGFVSVISFNNTFYVIKKVGGSAKAIRCMDLLRSVFTAVELDAQIINQAIDAHFTDFEDAIQCFSAVRSGAQILITRNVAHFAKADIPATTPEEFLAIHRTRRTI